MPLYILATKGKNEREEGCIEIQVNEEENKVTGDGATGFSDINCDLACNWDDGVTGLRFSSIVDNIVTKISNRENCTLVAMGQPESGKSRSIHTLIDLLIKGLQEHILISHDAWEDTQLPVVEEKPILSNTTSTTPDRVDDPFAAFPTKHVLPSLSKRSGGAGKRSSQAAQSRGNSKRLSSISELKQAMPIGTVVIHASENGEKFSGVPSNPGRASLSGKPPNPRSPSNASTNRRVTLQGVGEAPPGSPFRRRSTVNSQQSRNSTTALLPGSVTTLVGNGKRNSCNAILFDGQKSHVTFPVIPNLEKAMLSGLLLTVWIRQVSSEQPATIIKISDESQAAPCLCLMVDINIHHQYDEGAVLLQIFDSDHKCLEAQISGLTLQDTWTCLEWNIYNLEDHKVTCNVNGESLPIRIGQAEYPSNFGRWSQRGIIGANHTSEDTIDNQFCGYISEVQLATTIEDTHDVNTMLAYWQLEAPPTTKNETDSQISCKDLSTLSGSATAYDCSVQVEDFPVTSVRFNGQSTYLNVGPIGDFGAMLNGFVVEVLIKTTVTSRVMTVIGATDTTHKHPGFGLDLNSSSFGRLSPAVVCFWVRDCFSQVFAASIECQQLFDGGWHSVKWQVQDCYLNKMKVYVDKRLYALHFCPTKPTRQPEFAPFTQWICVGAHNNRGTVEKHFSGGLRHLRVIKGRGELRVAHWPLNEGPGSKVAIDTTGHGNNGIYFDGKKKLSRWLYDPNADRLATHDTAEPVRKIITSAMTNCHKNNKLEIACVAFGADPDETGAYKEVKYDVIHGDFLSSLGDYSYPLDTSKYPSEVADDRYFGIPLHCYELLKIDTYRKLVSDVIQRLQEDDLRFCNTAFTLKLGDASLLAFDFVGQQRNRRTAVFEPLHLSWVDTVATMGTFGKRKMIMNKTVQAAMQGLLETGTSPQLIKRCTAASSKERTRVAASFEGSDSSQLLRKSILCGVPSSNLFVLSTILKYPTPDEFTSLVAITRSIQGKTRYWAAVMIQKTFRACSARRKVSHLSEERECQRRRVEHRRSTRFSCAAATEAKTKKIAVLVAVTEYHNSSIPDHWSSENLSSQVEALLLKIGYEVHTFRDNYHIAKGPPTRDIVISYIKKIRSQQPDAQLFVYFCCRGVNGRYSRLPSTRTMFEWIEAYESELRSETQNNENSSWSTLQVQESVKYKEADEEMRQRLESEAKKNKKRQKSLPTTKAVEIKRKAMEEAAKKEASSKEAKDLRDGLVSPRRRGHRNSRSDRTGVDEVEECEPEPTENLEIKDIEYDDPDPCRYLLPGDVGNEFTPLTVWSVKELIDICLGNEPTLGDHSVLCIDALHQSGTRNDNSFGGFGLFQSSSAQHITIPYPESTQSGLLTHYLLKGLSGDAMPFPGEEDGELGVNKMISYLRSKLDKWFIHHEQELHGTYVGEIILAQKIVVKPEDKYALKTRGRSKKFRAEVTLRTDINISLNDSIHEVVVKCIQAMSLSEVSVDVKTIKPIPFIRIVFDNPNWNNATRNPSVVEKWTDEVSVFMREFTAGTPYTWKLEPTHVLSLTLLPDVSGYTSTPKECPLDERERLNNEYKKIRNFIEFVRSKIQISQSSISGFRAVDVEVCLKVIIHITDISRLDKLTRFSHVAIAQQRQMYSKSSEGIQSRSDIGNLNGNINIMNVRRFTELEEKEYSRWEHEISQEERRRAETAKQYRLSQIAERKAQEERHTRESKLKGAIGKRVTALIKEPSLSAKDVDFIFSVSDGPTWTTAFNCVLIHCRKSPASCTSLTALGMLDKCIIGMESYPTDWECVQNCLLIFEEMSRNSPPEEWLDKSPTMATHVFNERGLSCIGNILEPSMESQRLTTCIHVLTTAVGNKSVAEQFFRQHLDQQVSQVVEYILPVDEDFKNSIDGDRCPVVVEPLLNFYIVLLSWGLETLSDSVINLSLRLCYYCLIACSENGAFSENDSFRINCTRLLRNIISKRTMNDSINGDDKPPEINYPIVTAVVELLSDSKLRNPTVTSGCLQLLETCNEYQYDKLPCFKSLISLIMNIQRSINEPIRDNESLSVTETLALSLSLLYSQFCSEQQSFEDTSEFKYSLPVSVQAVGRILLADYKGKLTDASHQNIISEILLKCV